MENRNLVFITDGAVSIKKSNERIFSFRPYSIYLDWYHLRHKCDERVSSSFRGTKEEKNAIKKHLYTLLWAGKVDDAVSYLKNDLSSIVRNRAAYEDFIEYIDVRKRPYIPCYAYRREAGLLISSSPCEKDNDILVAKRQKHNGMSWSNNGSNGLASLNMVIMNAGLDQWLLKRTIPFEFRSASDYAA